MIKRAGVGAAVVVACLGFAACNGHPAATAPSATPTSAVPIVPTTPPPPPPVSPLTGQPPAGATVVAVKVDNVSSGAQTGLNNADVVYCELVEGGLTRLVAIFASQQPTKVGPVRSARDTDVQLLGQFGRVALTFSGANAGVVAAVRSANLQNDVYDNHPDLYLFDTSRQAPYRYLVDIAKVVADAPGATAQDIGFRFGPALATATSVTPAVSGVAAPLTLTARFPAATVAATWDVPSRSWLISRDGRPQTLTDGTQASATNVLVQYVKSDGAAIPTSTTIGSGQAVLFRDGARYDGTWSRPSLTGPTTWTATGGGELTMSPGRTWVLLLPVGSSLTVT